MDIYEFNKSKREVLMNKLIGENITQNNEVSPTVGLAHKNAATAKFEKVSPEEISTNETLEKSEAFFPKWIKTSKQWENWFWKTNHPLCFRCIKKCRQSNKVKILICRQFEKTLIS